MSSYDALAASYDALTVDVEYRRRADYLTRQFHRSALPVETVLDLACGTGTMACLLAERGYRMIAVDGSEEMLTQAAWKAAALEQPPMFLHQSMPRLHLGMEVDAAISTLDALNYLTRTADLRETLRRVYRWLRPGGKLDVGAAVGHEGTLTVIRDLNMKEPYVGSVSLLGGEIAEDLAAYFVESEQIPTACGLGVLVDRDQSVLAAGGYLIQLLPGAGEDVIAKVEGSLMAAGPVTGLLRNDPDPEAMLRHALSDFDLEILERSPIEYRCYCSRDRMERALISLGPEELQAMIDEQGSADLTCRFCDNVQHFSRADLEAMVRGLQKKM